MPAAVELLVFAADADGAAELVSMLSSEGFRADLATGIATARGLFLERGGHALLVVAQGVGPGRAAQVIEALRAVDQDLPVVIFGADEQRGGDPPHVHRIRSFHPASRAGIGALRQVLCSLPPA
jgi:hypothetical protein